MTEPIANQPIGGDPRWTAILDNARANAMAGCEDEVGEAVCEAYSLGVARGVERGSREAVGDAADLRDRLKATSDALNRERMSLGAAHASIRALLAQPTAEQEIRARALDAAVRYLACYDKPATQRQVAGHASVFAAYITDGTTP